jgi:MFS transporter, BCD family, chlorophyll transporter
VTGAALGWLGILRLALVQAALGSIVVLTTSTMNRVMVVELALPAMLPGALVTFHYALQVLRPRFGHGSDGGRRRTPWILGGMAVLAVGGVAAAVATAWMAQDTVAGVTLAVIAFALIGVGVGAAGTSLLALLASRVEPERRAAAAMVMWMLMIAGIVVTAVTAGHFLDPYSSQRLVVVTASVAGVAMLVTLFAVLGVEPHGTGSAANTAAARLSFNAALRRTWSEPEARRFTVFVFVSMIAYSAQDLILEPFAGTVFALSPGASTKLAGLQHAGVFAGMAAAGLLGSGRFGVALFSLRAWTVGGCIASALALGGLVLAALMGPPWPLKASVFALGAANGTFAVAAIGSMMMLAGEGHSAQEGVRVGLWGAAQAIGFALGGFLGTVGVDLTRGLLDVAAPAYAMVFAVEALLFLTSAVLAARVAGTDRREKEARGLRGAPVGAAGAARGAMS